MENFLELASVVDIVLVSNHLVLLIYNLQSLLLSIRTDYT